MTLMQIWFSNIIVCVLYVLVKGEAGLDTAAASFYFSTSTLLVVHFLGKKGGA